VLSQKSSLWKVDTASYSGRSQVVAVLRLENDTSCVVLYSLQLLDAVAGSAVEHSIAVVDPGQDQITGQCLCQFRSQQVSNVSDGLCMVIARSRHHRRDVLVKRQTPIEHFDLIGYRQVNSGHGHR